MKPLPSTPPSSSLPARAEWKWVGLLQALFLLTALYHLDAPFLSTHFLRQSFTFDMAQHVFHEGWTAVIEPKGSFTQLTSPDDRMSPLANPAPRYTFCHLEVPFYGVFGWPAAQVFPHAERAVVRMVAVAFSILSIRFLYLILRFWLDPLPALIGTTLWATAPLILHFGQVPMPDIMAAAGIAMAFYFGLRGYVAASSGAFLFALLAKMSIIPYGLPVLVALVVARDCRTIGNCIKLAVLWGMLPALGLIGWILLGLHQPPGSWVVVGGYKPGNFSPPTIAVLMTAEYYFLPLFYIFPLGIGLIGLLGLLFAAVSAPPLMNRWVKISIILALFSNYAMARITAGEPQYTVPVLLWVIIAASFGFSPLLEKLRKDRLWKIAAVVIVLVQVVVVICGTWYLKASRVTNLPDMQAAISLTPADARVVVYTTIANQAPPVWLKRNTLTITPTVDPSSRDLNRIAEHIQNYQKAGFDYLIVIDARKHFDLGLMEAKATAYTADFTSASSPTRQFFDSKYHRLFERNHVVLYSLGD